MRFNLPRLALCVLLLTPALMSSTGCVTAQRVDPAYGVQLTVLSADSVEFLGQPAQLENLGKTLRKAGVRPNQEIRVHLRDAHDTPTMQRLTAMLANGGFRRVVFTTPRHAASFLPDEQKAPATTP
jgi:hypothetical protein